MRHVAAVSARALGFVVALLIGVSAGPWAAGASSLNAAGSSTNLTVSGVDNIYGAGLTTAPDPGGDGGGDVPVDVPIPSGTTWISFSDVSGIVFNTAGASNGPDGRAGQTGITAAGSLSGITDTSSLFFMVGVFLDGPQPSPATTPPATLDFSGAADFASLSPDLDQVFFVGDGVTGTGSGDEQYFQVPTGATDVYLGFADGSSFNGPTGTYGDNSGSLNASVNFFTGDYTAVKAKGGNGTLIGGLDVAGYCASVDNSTAELVKGGVTGTNFAYKNWECSGTSQLVTMTNVCRWEYPNAKDPVAKTDNANSAYSWQCYAGASLARHRASAGSGDTNLVRDGGFEKPTVSGDFLTFAGGSKLGAWTVTGNSVDLVATGYLAAHTGSQEVDLSGTNYNGPGNGGLAQDLATTPGRSYVLTYWEGGNEDGPPTVKSLTVSFGGQNLGSTSYTGGGAAYIKYSFTVVANSTRSALVFSSSDPTNWGPILDDVSVYGGGAVGDVAPIASSIGTPRAIFHNMGHNLVNASITVAAILFITFPSTIFNQTFASNYGEILLMVGNFRRRVRKALGLKEKPVGLGPEPGSVSVASAAPASAATEVVAGAPGVADAPGRSSRPWFYGVLLAGAVLGGLLNPSFGFNERSLADIGATLVSFALGTLIGWFIAKTFREHHHYPTHTYLHALPLGLAVAALCVLVSRLTNFEPGYLYGVVVSIAFVESLEERHNAHLTAISTLSTLGVALLAWFLWVPVNHFALEHSHDVILAIVDDVLASIFIGGLVGTVIGLLPLEFMPGGTLARWRKDVWAVVFFIAIFLLVEVELRPAAGPTHPGGAPIVTALVLFAIFGGGTFWMRHYFAKRKAAHSTESDLGATETVVVDGVGPVTDDA